jgi:hypothetical protein
MEHLEGRQLLASTHDRVDFSVGQMHALLQPVLSSITSVTVVTHGFQLFNDMRLLADGGDSLMDVAKDVQTRAGGAGKSILLDYDIVDGASGFDKLDSSFTVDTQGGSTSTIPTHATLLWDWADDSNEHTGGWMGAAGDALFSTLVGLGFVDPSKGAAHTRSLHFIGHSFGTVVTSEAVKRLSAYNVPVDQVTYLDPHDFDQGIPWPANESKQQGWTHGLPQAPGPSTTHTGYGVTRWSNVAFTDVYYQTSAIDASPEGRPIPGAYNRHLPSQSLMDGSIAGDHTDVWDMFYRNTINNPSAAGGFNFSRIGNPTKTTEQVSAVRPAQTNFFDASQDHYWSSEILVAGDFGSKDRTAFNDSTATGGPAIGLETQAEAASYAATATRGIPTVANGDLAFRGDGTARVPGWSSHGGEGPAPITSSGALVIRPGATWRAHNISYVPHDASALVFSVRRTKAHAGDRLTVRFDGDELARFVLPGDGGSTDGRIILEETDDVPLTFGLDIAAFKNKAGTLTLQLERGISDGGAYGAEVEIDDFRFLDSAAAIAALTTPGIGGTFFLDPSTPFRAGQLEVPATAAFLDFSMKRQVASPGDELVVAIKGRVVDRISLDAVDAEFFTRRVPVPALLRGAATPPRVSFRIDRLGTNNSTIEGAVTVDDIRMTSVAGLTGDLIPLDISTLLQAPIDSTFTIASAQILDRTASSGRHELTRTAAIDTKGKELRSDVELTFTDTDGNTWLAGYLLFSDRVEPGKVDFEKTGRAWFAPATGAYRRITDTSPNTKRAVYFERVADGTIAGDRNTDPLAAGFQGRIGFGITVTNSAHPAGMQHDVVVDVSEGFSAVGADAASAEGVERKDVLAIARVQQRLNYLHGKLRDPADAAAGTITSDDGSRSPNGSLQTATVGRPLVVDGIKEVLTERAIQRFKATTETGQTLTNWTSRPKTPTKANIDRLNQLDIHT